MKKEILKPVSKSNAEIVGDLAKKKKVEELIGNITHREVKEDLCDLVQIVYVALLETNSKQLKQLATSGEIKYYIVRIIQNQYFSATSPFYRVIRKFRDVSDPISFQMADTLEDK